MYENVQSNDTLQQKSFNPQYLFNARERTHDTLHHLFFILLIRNFFTDILFSTYELTSDLKFRQRRYIIHIYKLNTYKLNNWLNLS